jgi:hypothetical protein
MMAKQEPVIIRNPVPTVEEFRKSIGMSKKRADRIRKIMETPVPRKKREVAYMDMRESIDSIKEELGKRILKRELVIGNV